MQVLFCIAQQRALLKSALVLLAAWEVTCATKMAHERLKNVTQWRRHHCFKIFPLINLSGAYKKALKPISKESGTVGRPNSIQGRQRLL
jgi:hypothetical protein